MLTLSKANKIAQSKQDRQAISHLWKCVKAQVAFTLAESGQRPHLNPGFGRCAFTLAETLIALAVIGIVAALTIPGLVKNYNQKAWGHAQDVFSKKLDVALKEMNTEGTLTGYRTTEAFVNELKKNIKITKVCTGTQITNCFADKVVWNEGEEPIEITTSSVQFTGTADSDWAEPVGIQFVNGVNAIIGYNKNCASDPYNNQFATGSCIGIMYDVSGFKKPNARDKDIAYSNVALSGCAFSFTYKGETVCFTKVLEPDTGYSPLPITKADGSKIYCSTVQDDLGISNCEYGEEGYRNNDYWAGAAYACGGVKKMASEDQLTLLAKYLYNTDSLPTSVSNEEKIQTDRLGPFKSYYDSNTYYYSSTYPSLHCFYVWASAEYGRTNAYYGNFYSSYAYYGFNGSNRSDTRRFAVCVE